MPWSEKPHLNTPDLLVRVQKVFRPSSFGQGCAIPERTTVERFNHMVMHVGVCFLIERSLQHAFYNHLVSLRLLVFMPFNPRRNLTSHPALDLNPPSSPLMSMLGPAQQDPDIFPTDPTLKFGGEGVNTKPSGKVSVRR